MITVTVTNQKGGVGKTTTVGNLAACIAETGKKVLCIDLDPQASLSYSFAAPDGGKALLRVLTELEPITDFIHSSNLEGVDIVPGSKWSAFVETRLASEVLEGHPNELRLREALDGVQGYDVVMVDTPPALGWLVSNAVYAADTVIVPVEAHIMAMNAVSRLLESLKAWKLNPKLHIVPVRVDRRNRHTGEVVERLRKNYGEAVTQAQIRENIRVAEAWGWRKPVITYDPKSSGATDYRALAQELFS